MFKVNAIGIKAIAKQLERNARQSEAAVSRAIKDIKKRAPGVVAKEVTAVYKIPKSEIMPAKFDKATGKWSKTVGGARVIGQTIDDLKIVYSGRSLTPIHFNMSPKTPPKGKGYTVKAEIIAGRKKTLGKVKRPSAKTRERFALNFKRQGRKTSPRSPIMLMHTGNTRVGGVNYIPFRRNTFNRTDVEAIHTVGVPQMVSGHLTAPKIEASMQELLRKRFEYHLKLDD